LCVFFGGRRFSLYTGLTGRDPSFLRFGLLLDWRIRSGGVSFFVLGFRLFLDLNVCFLGGVALQTGYGLAVAVRFRPCAPDGVADFGTGPFVHFQCAIFWISRADVAAAAVAVLAELTARVTAEL
jgi:hypothetical protein